MKLNGIKISEVALLAEGVDRNAQILALLNLGNVALLAEGVDRNVRPRRRAQTIFGRSPRGGRG